MDDASSVHPYVDLRACEDVDVVSCVFCGGEVEDTDTDPVEIRVLHRLPPADGSLWWSVYGHRSCLVERFTEEDRLALALMDEDEDAFASLEQDDQDPSSAL